MAQRIQEKSRYKILREFGYSSKEAQKFRRYGYDKFLQKLAEKADTLYKQSKYEVLRHNIFEEKAEQKQERIKRLKGEKNQLRKYNYLVVIVYEDRQEKKREQYVTIKTDRKLSIAELKKEVNNLSWFYRDNYDMKRIIGYFIDGVKIRP